MSKLLDRLLTVMERHLPDAKSNWISDLRTEALHIPQGLGRLRFQGSGLLAAMGHILRFRFGPQKIGQMLLGAALFVLCLGGFLFMVNQPNDYVKTAFYSILPLYAVAGMLAVLNLRLMKRFTVGCGVLLAGVWMVLGLGFVPEFDGPIEFIRAISLEAAFIMAGLFIAASYLGWIEETAHA